MQLLDRCVIAELLANTLQVVACVAMPDMGNRQQHTVVSAPARLLSSSNTAAVAAELPNNAVSTAVMSWVSAAVMQWWGGAPMAVATTPPGVGGGTSDS
jgi:hypothetical protein